MDVINKPIAELIPYVNNPRNNDAAVEAVASSIAEFGFKQPIVIDKDGVVVCGHTRLKAAKKLGLEEAPCVVADDLTPAQIKAYRLADNKVAEAAEWNDELLELELIELKDFGIDMSDFGFEAEAEELPEVIEDEAPEPPKEPKAKPGDIYKLGDHLLMCGDATSIDDVQKLIGEAHIQLALTDPPYGVKAVESGGHNNGKQYGHSMAPDNVYEPIIGDDTTETAQQHYDIIQALTDSQVLFGGNYFTDFLPPSRCWIVWDKDVAGSFADGELAWTSFDANLRIYKHMWSGMRREGTRDIEGVTRIHPTQKPVGLMAAILRDFSSEADNILDCFGGSGSTLMACEQTGRNCYMMEMSPAYIDAIIERWEKFTGQKAVLLNEN